MLKWTTNKLCSSLFRRRCCGRCSLSILRCKLIIKKFEMKQNMKSVSIGHIHVALGLRLLALLVALLSSTYTPQHNAG